MTKAKQLWLCLSAIALCVSCSWIQISPHPEPDAMPPSPEEETMESTHQIFTNRGFGFDKIPNTLGYNLNIWAYNFWKDTYIDAQGNERQGKTCAMSLTVKDGSAPGLQARFYVGQEFTYSKYAIKIVTIDSEAGNSFVEIAIKPLETLPVEWVTTIRANDEGPYTIPKNVQLIYRDNNLLIGTGNFGFEEYKKDIDKTSQVKITKDVATLWLSTRDGSLQNQQIQVHSGQEITYGPYSLKVIAVLGDHFRNINDIGLENFTHIVLISIDII